MKSLTTKQLIALSLLLVFLILPFLFFVNKNSKTSFDRKWEACKHRYDICMDDSDNIQCDTEALENCIEDLMKMVTDQSICQDVKYSDECYYYAIPSLKDPKPEYCSVIKNASNKDSCLFSIFKASGRNDLTICDEFIDEYMKYVCVDLFIKKTKSDDLSICDNFKEISYTYYCIRSIAVATENVDLCKEIPQQNYIDSCYLSYAQNHDDSTYCNLIKNEEQKKECHELS